MLAIKLAFRNIFANAQRSSIVFLVMCLVSMVLFLLLAFSDGEIENFKKGIGGLQSPEADLVAMAPGTKRAMDAEEDLEILNELTITDFPLLRDRISELGLTREIYPLARPVVSNVFVNSKQFRDLRYLGVETGHDEHYMSRIDVVEGRAFEAGDEGFVLPHVSMKEDFRAEVGDPVTVLGRTLFNQVIAEDLVISGYFQAKVDNPLAYSLALVDMSGFYLISGLRQGETHFLHLVLAEGIRAGPALEQLRQWALDEQVPIELYAYDDVYEGSASMYSGIRVMVVAICLVVILVVMFGIMNVVSVNLVDRQKEIGTYYCLGAERPFLKRMYSLEILLVNLGAAVAGIGLGLVIRGVLNGMKITAANPGVQMVLGGNQLHLGVSLSSILWIVLGGLLVTGLTALSTLGSALRVSPVAAIRETEG